MDKPGYVTLKCPNCGWEQQVLYDEYIIYSLSEYHGYICHCSAKMELVI